MQVATVGEQKGVDSLIVTDLIELARNGAMSDALLLSGDEDVRIGVQIAQSFGVRVHLLGVESAKSSQSPLLLQEADTTSRWTKTDVDKFLTVAPSPPAAPASAKPTEKKRDGNLEKIAVDLAGTLDDDQMKKFAEYRKMNRGVPSEFDGKLIARGRDTLGRDLNHEEESTRELCGGRQEAATSAFSQSMNYPGPG
jgi:hypothetical protein